MNGDKAILISNMMEGQQCMRFKYHMHGEDVGSLSIYRRGFLIWKKTGNHGNEWLNGQVDLDCKIPKYQVSLEMKKYLCRLPKCLKFSQILNDQRKKKMRREVETFGRFT